MVALWERQAIDKRLGRVFFERPAIVGITEDDAGFFLVESPSSGATRRQPAPINEVVNAQGDGLPRNAAHLCELTGIVFGPPIGAGGQEGLYVFLCAEGGFWGVMRFVGLGAFYQQAHKRLEQVGFGQLLKLLE